MKVVTVASFAKKHPEMAKFQAAPCQIFREFPICSCPYPEYTANSLGRRVPLKKKSYRDGSGHPLLDSGMKYAVKGGCSDGLVQPHMACCIGACVSTT